MRFYLVLFCISLTFGVIYGRDRVKNFLKDRDIDESRLKFLELRNVDDKWGHFISAYQKEYASDDEKEVRRANFERADALITENQKQFAEGKVSYVLGHNQFSDLSPEEFKAKYLTVGRTSKGNFAGKDVSLDASNATVDAYPHSLDLRTDAIPVKDQKQCGSCWAFSGTGIIEYFRYVQNGYYTALSEQYAMDCSQKTNGCNGGWPHNVLQYYITNGLATGDIVPYTASSQSCRVDRKTVKKSSGTIYNGLNGPNSWSTLSPNTEDALKVALNKFGWVSICVNATIWSHYMGGIMQDPIPNDTGIDHAVILVGYTDGGFSKLDSWIIRNSWGPNWGEGGYIQIERGVNAFAIVSQADTSTYVTKT